MGRGQKGWLGREWKEGKVIKEGKLMEVLKGNCEKKRLSKRHYGRTAERRVERVREMRAMMIAGGGMEFRNDTQRRGKLEGVRRGIVDLKKSQEDSI